MKLPNPAKLLAQRGLAAHQPPARRASKDPNRGQYHKLFADEYRKACERLEPLGGRVVWGEHDYEAFTWECDGLRLIFYPHKVRTTGNVHVRVRSVGSNAQLLRRAIFALAENSCTFQYPMDRVLHDAAVRASIERDRR